MCLFSENLQNPERFSRMPRPINGKGDRCGTSGSGAWSRIIRTTYSDSPGASGSRRHGAFADGIRTAAREFGLRALANIRDHDKSVRVYYTLDGEDMAAFYFVIRDDETLILASIQVDLARVLEATGCFKGRRGVTIDWSNARSPSTSHRLVTG